MAGEYEKKGSRLGGKSWGISEGWVLFHDLSKIYQKDHPHNIQCRTMKGKLYYENYY
jgi:hypothetical protein